MKKRLDVLLFEKGFFDSREKARIAIMEGLVYVNKAISDKPGTQVPEDALLEVKGQVCPYVSRGGYKLAGAIEAFGLDVSGKVCMDIGSSTGGFTDCLLQNGAAKVYAVDVGTNQLAYKLRVDLRVVCMEKTNFRNFDTASVEEKMDFACTDVSFISLKHIFKPQFEAGRAQVGKKGIVKDPAVHVQVIENVIGYAREAGLYPCGLDHSPITGTTGNIEFLLLLSKDPSRAQDPDIKAVVDKAHGKLEV